MVDSRYLAEFNRIDQKRDIAMTSQPNAMVLILHFGAPGTGCVPAKVKHRRLPTHLVRDVQVSGNVESRHALENYLFYAISLSLESPGNRSVKRRLRRQRIQAQHKQKLLP